MIRQRTQTKETVAIAPRVMPGDLAWHGYMLSMREAEQN